MDGSREGFVDMTTYPGIAACEGVFEGFISSVSAKSLCSSGWHVCTGLEVQQREITVQEADAFPGAFAFDSANDCGNCHETCLGRDDRHVDQRLLRSPQRRSTQTRTWSAWAPAATYARARLIRPAC